jgi:hypothetical protein
MWGVLSYHGVRQIRSREYGLTLSLVPLYLLLNQCGGLEESRKDITIMISLYVLNLDRKNHKRHILLASRDFARSAWTLFCP